MGEGEKALTVQLHHVALVSRDPERSAEFYESIFGLSRLERSPFKIEGVWLDCGAGLQLHLTKQSDRCFFDAAPRKTCVSGE